MRTSRGSTVSTGMACMDQNAEEVARTSFLMRKLRWFQLLKDFNCTVTSTWVDADDRGECHTGRAWGSRIRQKQIDYTRGVRKLSLNCLFPGRNNN